MNVLQTITHNANSVRHNWMNHKKKIWKILVRLCSLRWQSASNMAEIWLLLAPLIADEWWH